MSYAYMYDVLNNESIAAMINKVAEDLGGIYGLVNHCPGPKAGTFEALTEADWADGYQKCLYSYTTAICAALPYMKKGGGRIVNSTSSSIKQELDNLILSNTFRMGVVGMSKTMAREFGPYNIMVNTMGPGRIYTDRIKRLNTIRAEKAGITLEECAELARQLAKRIADELHVPTYCYEAAAFTPERRNLAVCRAGEYEALPEKMNHEGKAPDFGDRPFDEGVARTGATAVGARDFLIAVNYNLNTTSTRRANAIAFDVREKGRPVREGNSPVGKPLKDENGKTIMKPGTLKATKAIGWFIDEYQIAQVSMNITNISVTPLHVAFDEVCRAANARGVRVTGTEIVGLIPKRTLIEAGRYFLKKQERSTGISEEEIIRIAIKSMGLDELKPFKPEEKVIEYLIEADNKKKKLVDLTCTGFAEETASESPAPGGGSISAYMGALGAALGTMVANLSSHKPGWDARWEEFSDWADKGQKLMTELLHLVDEDTEAFNRIMNVFSMPKGTDEEKAARSAALQEATLYATQVPLRTMQTSFKVFEIVKAMAEQGNPNSVTDAGVGALAARSAVLGACLNVKINAAGLKDRAVADDLIGQANRIVADAEKAEREILEIVESKIK